MDFIAGAFELIGMIIVGNKNRIGFILNMIGNLIWIILAFELKIYGLLLVVVPAIFINLRNWIKWK